MAGVRGAFGIAVFGMLFANATEAVMLIVLGVLVTLCNNWMSVQLPQLPGGAVPDPHPRAGRGLRVFLEPRLDRAHQLHDRLHSARFRRDRRTAFIAASMGAVVVSIGVFGPRTRGLALEQISR